MIRIKTKEPMRNETTLTCGNLTDILPIIIIRFVTNSWSNKISKLMNNLVTWLAKGIRTQSHTNTEVKTSRLFI